MTLFLWTAGTALLILGAYGTSLGGYLLARARVPDAFASLVVVIGFVLVGGGAYLWHLA